MLKQKDNRVGASRSILCNNKWKNDDFNLETGRKLSCNCKTLIPIQIEKSVAKEKLKVAVSRCGFFSTWKLPCRDLTMVIPWEKNVIAHSHVKDSCTKSKQLQVPLLNVVAPVNMSTHKNDFRGIVMRSLHNCGRLDVVLFEEIKLAVDKYNETRELISSEIKFENQEVFH